MITSEETDKIYPAYFEAKKSFRKPKKTAVNPHYKSRFAPLEECMDSVEGALAEKGIFITQTAGVKLFRGDASPNLVWAMTTRLVHAESGQWMETSVPLKGDGKPQDQGSAITYARRYGLCLGLGLVAEDDDDGNGSSGKASDTTSQTKSERVSSSKQNGSPGSRFGGRPTAGGENDASILDGTRVDISDVERQMSDLLAKVGEDQHETLTRIWTKHKAPRRGNVSPENVTQALAAIEDAKATLFKESA